MNQSWAERLRTAFSWFILASAALILPLAAGFEFARLFAPTLHSKYFPWITGRALGIAGYVSLTALVILGIWIRHPWRLRRPVGHGETRLRIHATLATATVALVTGHIVSLASDHYAGVGWSGAFVPGLSKYRTFAVSLGVIAMFFMILLFVTARTAGRRGSRHWYTFHRLAVATFALVWVHGVLAGADTAALRVLYITTGVGVGVLALTRYGASRSTPFTSDEVDPSAHLARSTVLAGTDQVPR